MLVMLSIYTAPALAADLAKIERALVKEPHYQSGAPKYALLVFGPEAKRTAWLVLDGSVLYLDRNSNGKLDEQGERIGEMVPVSAVGSELHMFDKYYFSDSPMQADWKASPTLKDSDQYTDFRVEIAAWNRRFVAKTEEQKRLFAKQRGDQLRVSVRVDGKHIYVGEALLADRPQEAPILHIDGPLTLAMGGDGVTGELNARLVTFGLGDGAMTFVRDASFPEAVYPKADITFPGHAPDGKPIQLTVFLAKRC
jgi:hypothetical protein